MIRRENQDLNLWSRIVHSLFLRVKGWIQSPFGHQMVFRVTYHLGK